MEHKQPQVKGKTIDKETRCVHYHSERDRIAIKFCCCGTYYPCIHCHDEAADHPVRRWPRQSFHRKAVLCGSCRAQLTVQEYLEAGNICPFCSAAFNPGCSRHHHLYFETGK